MSFLDSQQQGAEEQGPPQGAEPPGGAPAPGGAPGGPPGGPPPGGGPILAALANKQRQTPVSAPGPGDQAQSMNMLMQAVGHMNQALPGLMGHPAYQDVLKALQRINKHLPQGQPTLGVQRTQLQDLMQNLTKNGLLANIIGRLKGGASPDQPAGANPSPQAPMPSTPLPGA